MTDTENEKGNPPQTGASLEVLHNFITVENLQIGIIENKYVCQKFLH